MRIKATSGARLPPRRPAPAVRGEPCFMPKPLLDSEHARLNNHQTDHPLN